MTPAAVQAIEAMVAPVVLITAGGILSNGVLSVSGSVNDRMRAMNRERLQLLTGTDGALQAVTELSTAPRERVRQIDVQLPMLTRRHHLLRDAVLVVYAAIASLVLGVVTLGVTVTTGSGAAGLTALALVLAGTSGLLVGLGIAARSAILSHDAIDYETKSTLALGAPAPR